MTGDIHREVGDPGAEHGNRLAQTCQRLRLLPGRRFGNKFRREGIILTMTAMSFCKRGLWMKWPKIKDLTPRSLHKMGGLGVWGGILKSADIFKDGYVNISAGFPRMSSDEFCIVLHPSRACACLTRRWAAHASMREWEYFKTMLTQNFLVIVREILATAIPMMNASLQLAFATLSPRLKL